MATLGGVRSDAWTHELVAAIERHWRDHGFGLWTLRDRQTGAFVGRGGLRRVEVGGRREVEVAYVLARERWGSGLATELAIESARVAFDELGLEEIVAFTLPGNRASRAVMERTRLRFERNIVRADLPHVMYRLRARER
jgi:RimJ/RimL family protein N-acetyltransferase